MGSRFSNAPCEKAIPGPGVGAPAVYPRSDGCSQYPVNPAKGLITATLEFPNQQLVFQHSMLSRPNKERSSPLTRAGTIFWLIHNQKVVHISTIFIGSK
jgi:hypothetical protein